MLLGDWVDAAWSKLCAASPMMADPSEYQTMLYTVFWLGEEHVPKKKEERPTKGGAPPAAGKPVPRNVMRELAAEQERIALLRGDEG